MRFSLAFPSRDRLQRHAHSPAGSPEGLGLQHALDAVTFARFYVLNLKYGTSDGAVKIHRCGPPTPW